MDSLKPLMFYVDLFQKKADDALQWVNKQRTISKIGIYSVICSFGVLIGHNVISRLYRRYGKKYPIAPGLIGMPYFGSFFALMLYDQKELNHELLPSYGALTLYKMGQQDIMLINDLNIFKFIMKSDYCVNRTPQMVCKLMCCVTCNCQLTKE